MKMSSDAIFVWRFLKGLTLNIGADRSKQTVKTRLRLVPDEGASAFSDAGA